MMTQAQAIEALAAALCHDPQLINLLILAMGVPPKEATRFLKEHEAKEQEQEAVMEAERIIKEAQNG